MKSAPSRFVRMFMLALLLAMAAWRPAVAAGRGRQRFGASRQRDRGFVQGHRQAAGGCRRARSGKRQYRPAQRSRDQRLRRHRADGLYPVGADRRRRQRQPAPGRHRARARPCRRRPFDPHRRRREGCDRHHARDAGARCSGDGGWRRRCRNGHHDGRAAGGAWQVPRLYPDAGSHRRPGRREIPFGRRDQRQGPARFLRQAPEPGVSPRELRQGQLRLHPPAILGARPGAGAEVPRRPGMGQAAGPGAQRPLPSREGQAVRLSSAQAGGDQISRERPERAGPLCPRLCLSCRRLSRTKRCRRPMRC